MRIAINGFGRIGRLVVRALLEREKSNIEIIAINDPGGIETNAHLLKYDSLHGRIKDTISVAGDVLNINDKKITIVSEREISKLPWKELNIDLVLDCTGKFTTKELAKGHIEQGAKRVMVSAPCKDADLTIVYGVNHQKLKATDIVLSSASCTTNCLAPVAHILHQSFGFKKGFMTSIHAYTGDQTVHDRNHKDLRRARAAALSMIPTSTGAAKAIGLVLPELSGKLDGTAIRVPTANVSLIDLVFETDKSMSVEAVNSAMETAANSALKGVLAVNKLPLVSTDFNHTSHSAIFDATQTQLVDDKFARIVAWYDNEWAFSQRMIDICQYLDTIES